MDGPKRFAVHGMQFCVRALSGPSSQRRHWIVELKTPRTTEVCTRTLLLAAFLAVALQPAETPAQDKNRAKGRRPGYGQRDLAGRGFPGGAKGSNAAREADSTRKSRYLPGSGRTGTYDDRNKERVSYFQAGDFNSQQIDDGFIFVDGNFLPGPYTFRSAGEQTYVNDVLIAHELTEFETRFSEDDDDEGQSRRRRNGEARQTLAEFIGDRVDESQYIVVAFAGQQPEIVPLNGRGRALLCALVNNDDRATLLPDITQHGQTDEEAADWSEWITGYQPTNDFLQKAQPIVDKVNAAFAESMARQTAIRRLDRSAYPLSIAGMFMSVFAIGHLLSNPPNGGKSPDEVDDSPEVLQIVTRSLALVVALSLLDLVWTLLASQAGAMREMNPLGGRLIDDPMMLILFKVILTGLAAGLIFKLRQCRRAQLASWWACLILTLLTVRWLTFNSMLA